MKRRVIIVEENLAMRYLLSSLLSGLYKTKTYPNCYVAAEQMSHDDFDLAIISVENSKSDSYNLLIHMHFSSVYSNTPVIVLANNATEEFKRACFDLGVESLIDKPFNPVTLLGEIKNLFGVAKQNKPFS